jgi:apolipoprotein N-acyltransferase
MPLLSRIAEKFRAMQGWKAYASAFVLGLCYTLAFPPFWLLPLAILGFCGWLWLLQGAATPRRAFMLGWWFGFGHHTTGLYWICIALGIDGGAFWWLMPFALCVLPAYLALYTGAVGWVFAHIRRRPFEQVVCFSVVWVVAEYLRAHFIYGFPWNLSGYVWTISDATLQAASLVGAYGLSLWAVLFCAAFSLLTPPRPQDRMAAGKGFIAVMLASLAIVAWGHNRLQGADEALQAPTDVTLRLVQANVEQSLKWDPLFQREALERHVRMSAQEPVPDYIIWPETAMPYRVEEGSEGAAMLSQLAPPQGSIITGAVRSEGQGEDWQVWNSLRAVSTTGRVTATYDKAVLVPFGEFIPLRGLLPVEKVTQGAKDFSAGPGPQVLSLGGAAPLVQPLICYEAIFADFGDGAPQQPSAGWLLNVTNDAWFGTSTGPYQHLHMARTRAVERGLPLVRVANTGVTAVFDAFGREVASLPLNTQGVLDVELPPALAVSGWYSKHGEFTLIIICYILLIYSFRASSKIVG